MRYISPCVDMCSPYGTYLCMNGGVCEYDNLIEDVKCVCPYKYKGKYCEIGKISLNYCLNSFWSIIITRYLYHILIIDNCSHDGESVCQNGGSCHVIPNGKVECSYIYPFSGTYCEIGI